MLLGGDLDSGKKENPANMEIYSKEKNPILYSLSSMNREILSIKFSDTYL